MTNVRPGQLAVIVQTVGPTENIGKIVRVERELIIPPEGLVYNGLRFVATHVPDTVWEVTSLGSPLVCRNTHSTALLQTRPFADRCLRPLTGKPSKKQGKVDEKA